MRHLKGGFKLGRNPASRKALLRNLTASLIEKNRIQTTLAKAKAVRPTKRSCVEHCQLCQRSRSHHDRHRRIV